MTQIKQHTLQSGERILMVSVRDDAKIIYVATAKDNEAIVWQCDDERTSFDTLPKGNWQLIGLYDEISEEQARTLVEKRHSWQPYYTHSLSPYSRHSTALESFKSLMQSLGCEGRHAVLREVI